MDRYKIIGGDGREYGPISLDELKDWIREGRVSKETLIWRMDLGSWTPASKFSELEISLRDLYSKNPEIEDVSAQGFRRVGFWPRLGAYFIDQIILSALFSVIWPLAAKSLGYPVESQITATTLQEALEQFNKMAVTVLPVLYGLNFIYYVTFNGFFSATPGKMAIGAKIVRLNGRNIGVGSAIVRWFGERVSDMTCYIGYFFIAFRADKRALHDLIAGTQVIYKR